MGCGLLSNRRRYSSSLSSSLRSALFRAVMSDQEPTTSVGLPGHVAQHPLLVAEPEVRAVPVAEPVLLDQAAVDEDPGQLRDALSSRSSGWRCSVHHSGARASSDGVAQEPLDVLADPRDRRGPPLSIRSA